MFEKGKASSSTAAFSIPPSVLRKDLGAKLFGGGLCAW